MLRRKIIFMQSFSKTTCFMVCLVIGLIGVCQTPVTAAEPEASTSSSDPLDDLLGISTASGLKGGPVRVSAAVEKNATTGKDHLVVTASVESGVHIYSLTQKSGGPKPTRIVVDPSSPFLPDGDFASETPARAHTVDDIPSWKGLILEEHSGTVRWSVPLRQNPDRTSGSIAGTVSFQACRDSSCMPPATVSFSTQQVDESSSATNKPAHDAKKIETARASYRPQRGRLQVDVVLAESDGASTIGELVINLVPDEGHHLYGVADTDRSGIGEGKPTILSLSASDALTVTSVRSSANPSEGLFVDGKQSTAVDGPITLRIATESMVSLDQKRTLQLLIGFQTCTAQSCDQPWGIRIDVAFGIGVQDKTTIGISDAKYAEAAINPVAVIPEQKGASDQLTTIAESSDGRTPAAPKSLSLVTVLFMGLAGGLILNLMPCVLPVLGLKLMSFAQQAGQDRRHVIEMNLWYVAGLFAVFMLLATASVAANIGIGSQNLAWGEQFTSTRFNVAMSGIVFAMALSFLGVWEIPVPGFIGESAGKIQTREGPLGSFLKGVLSTVLATPCSGPFLGPVFGFTLSQPTVVTYAVFGAIATGMSLPYLLVGMMPGLARLLPKPGAWMETLKEILGFVMLTTVVFLFTFLDKDYVVATFGMLIGIWAACWWVGRVSKHTGSNPTLRTWLQGVTVAVAMSMASFTFLGPVESILQWEPFSRSRLTELKQAGTTVMVDFSADWCLTCKLNLATAIETQRVKALIEENRVVPLLADWTEESAEIKSMLESLSSKSIPVLAIFPANRFDEPIILRDLLSESQVLEAIQRAGPSRTGPSESRSKENVATR